MNSPAKLCISSSLLAVLALGADADTFILKDGTTVEGSIIKQDATSYLIEVQVTKTIKDERTIGKADVVKVEAEKKDLTAFEAIAPLVPAPDALTANEYAARIATVETFLKDYRGSSKSREAKAILASLKEEANEILAGGIKFNGKIITSAEYRANALDIDAGIQEARVRALLKNGRIVEALRAFSEFDRGFQNTKARADLLPQIIQAINGYLAQTEHALAGHDAFLKEREIGLQRMQPEDRRRTQAALAEEAVEFDKRLKAEKEAKIGWVSTNPAFKASLDETMSFGKQELTRLSAAANPPAVDAGTAFRDSLRKIQNNADAAVKTAALNEAKTAMVSEKYFAILEGATVSR